MNPKDVVRIAVVTGVAAMCVGLGAPPALAHPPGSGASEAATSQQHKASVADVQASVDRFISNRSAWLADLSAKVAADPKISAAAKDKITSAIQQEQAALTALKAKVDSATTLGEVWSDVHAALSAMPHFWWHWWWFRPALHRSEHPAAARAGRHADPAKSRSHRDPSTVARPVSAARTMPGASVNRNLQPRFRLTFARFGRHGADPRFGSFSSGRHHHGGAGGFGHHRRHR